MKDERVASALKPIGRIMKSATGPTGATATLIGRSCAISCGHCKAFLGLTQFNVPPSGPKGELNYPPA
ncbi:MAG TPA: hypothetical protein VFV50_12090, partial [Bdellovibrionales bacterium]|nr:hypothetical protein [Bdellovibrionales bacterium]